MGNPRHLASETTLGVMKNMQSSVTHIRHKEHASAFKMPVIVCDHFYVPTGVSVGIYGHTYTLATHTDTHPVTPVSPHCAQPQLFYSWQVWTTFTMQDALPLGKTTTIHQVTTMPATSKNVLFPGHINLLTTGADDPSLAGTRLIKCWVISTGG